MTLLPLCALALILTRRSRRARVVFAALLAGLIMLIPSAVLAAPVAPVGVRGDSHALMITPVQWTILTGLLFPIVFALLVKAGANPKLKAVVGIVGAALAAVIERSQLADGSAVISAGLLLDIVLIYGPQLLAHYGFYSKFKLSAKTAPTFGIG